MKKNQLDFDSAISGYIDDHSLRETDLLAKLRAETAKRPDAIMQIPANQGQFMALMIKLTSAKKAIEIGVFTGYSSLCIAQAMPEDGYILACDVNEETAAIAKDYWQEAGVANMIDLQLNPAIETLKHQISEGNAGTFDFVFIDADKENYDTYYELSLELLKPGGLIAIDNVLLFGSVVDPERLDQNIRKRLTHECIESIDKLNKKIVNDERVDISMLTLGDGLSLVRKK